MGLLNNRRKIPLNTEAPPTAIPSKFKVGEYVYYTGLNGYIGEPRVIVGHRRDYINGTVLCILGHELGRKSPTETLTKPEHELTLISTAEPLYYIGDYVIVNGTIAYVKSVSRSWLQDIEYRVSASGLYSVVESSMHPFNLSKGNGPHYNEKTGLPDLPVGFNIEIVDGGLKDFTVIRTLNMHLIFRGEVVDTYYDIGELEHSDGMYESSLRVEVTAERVYMCVMLMREKALAISARQDVEDREMKFINMYPPASIKEIK